jgi:hypothetical protein
MDVSEQTGYSFGLASVLPPSFSLWNAVPSLLRARSSMDRVLPSEGRGCWFDPSRAHHPVFRRNSPKSWKPTRRYGKFTSGESQRIPLKFVPLLA